MSSPSQPQDRPKFSPLRLGRREFLYLLLMGVAVALSFARSIVFGAALGPEQMGYYSVATSIASYGMFLQLGLMNGLNRELPIRLGAGGTGIASNLIGETTISVLGVQAVGFVLYVVAIYLVTFDNELIRDAFLFGGILALSTPLLQLVMLRLRASQRVVEFAALQAIVALVIVVLGFWWIPTLAYRGAVLAAVVVNTIGFVAATVLWLEPVNYRYFNRDDVLYLIRVGAPMMLAGVVTSLVIGMDRLFLIKYATPSEVGIYQVASMPITLGVLCSGIFGQYLGPMLLFEFGESGDLRSVHRKSIKASVVVTIALLALSPLVTPVARIVFAVWLPEYADGLGMVLVMYLSAILIAANLFGIVISAANRHFSLLVGSVGVTLVGFALYVTISRMALPMIWYAYVNLALQALNYAVVLALAHRSVTIGTPGLDRAY